MSKNNNRNGLASKKHPEYGIYRRWCNLMHRCYNASNINYQTYGGIGVTVCDLWKYNFVEFYNWCKKNNYKECLQIDRIDNNKGYSPDNCQFIPQAENCAIGKRNLFSSNKTGVIGVYYNNQNHLYHARIRVNNKNIHLGFHKTIEDAKEARKNAEIKYFGEYKTEFLNKSLISFEFGEMEKAE